MQEIPTGITNANFTNSLQLQRELRLIEKTYFVQSVLEDRVQRWLLR